MENKLQLKAQSTDLALTLTTEKIDRWVTKIEKGLSLESIVESAKPISTLVRTEALSKIEVKQILDIHLTKLASSFNMNLNLKDHQIKVIVEDLLEKYSDESIEDFILLFKKARQGEFGEVYRIDSAVIFGWMKIHLEQKYQTIEDKLMKEKENMYKRIEVALDKVASDEKSKMYIKQMLHNIANSEIKAVPKPSKREIFEEGQEKRKQLPYKPMTKEQIILRRLESEWFRETHDITGKKKPDTLSFNEWVRTTTITEEEIIQDFLNNDKRRKK
jgi:hypothetical protein